MNFNSQICTNKEQSERLLALGLKKETADCVITYYDGWHIGEAEYFDFDKDPVSPAWSLHRLIEMCPAVISNPHRFVAISSFKTSLVLMTDKISDNFNRGKTYDNMIDCIEWLIKEGHFNKEYLEE